MKKILLILVLYLHATIVHATTSKQGDVIILAHGVYDMIFKSTNEDLKPFAEEAKVPIGGAKLVDTDFISKLIPKFSPIATAFGGSASNTAYILSSLGTSTGIYLVLSDEELSRQFVKTLTDVGVKNLGQYVSKADRGAESVMAKVCVFITSNPDGTLERTMFAYDGLSAGFNKIKLDLSQIENYKVLYIEGYSFNKNSKDTIFAAIDAAKKYGVKVAFTPSNPDLIDQYREDFKAIIDSSDLLFTTKAEVERLYEGTKKIDDAINKLAKRVDVVVVTNGKEGSIITSGSGSHTTFIPVVQDQSKVVDTTGAGDGYAAGFLHRYTKGYGIEDSGKAGAMVANGVIQEISARPSKEGIAKIIQHLKD